MRSYAQYCGLARGLDVIGDRWVLLIVRELLEGPRRYRDILDGLPGVATNLLAERLRSLREAGVLTRDDDGNYRLTERGEALREVVYAIGRWAAPLMGECAPTDSFRSHWLVHPIAILFPGVDPGRAPLTVEVRIHGRPMTITCAGGEVHVASGPATLPDVVLTGPPDAVVGLLAGRLSAAAARERGLSVEGDIRKLKGLRPAGANARSRATAPAR